jgi:hypothetical protein
LAKPHDAFRLQITQNNILERLVVVLVGRVDKLRAHDDIERLEAQERPE